MKRMSRLVVLGCVLTCLLPAAAPADWQQICNQAIAGHQQINPPPTSPPVCGAPDVAGNTTTLSCGSASSNATAMAAMAASASANALQITFSGEFMPQGLAQITASGCMCDGGPTPGEEFASATTSAELELFRTFQLAGVTYYKLEIFSIASPGTPTGGVEWELSAAGLGRVEWGSLFNSGSTAQRCFVAPPGDYVFRGEVMADDSVSASTAQGCSVTASSSGSLTWALEISSISCPSGVLDECCGLEEPDPGPGPLPKPGPGDPNPEA